MPGTPKPHHAIDLVEPALEMIANVIGELAAGQLISQLYLVRIAQLSEGAQLKVWAHIGDILSPFPQKGTADAWIHHLENQPSEEELVRITGLIISFFEEFEQKESLARVVRRLDTTERETTKGVAGKDTKPCGDHHRTTRGGWVVVVMSPHWTVQWPSRLICIIVHTS